MLSNTDVILLYVWSVQSLKGLFQPTKMMAEMMASSNNSRRMIATLTENAGGNQTESAKR
jgi:hypothetical protein